MHRMWLNHPLVIPLYYKAENFSPYVVMLVMLTNTPKLVLPLSTLKSMYPCMRITKPSWHTCSTGLIKERFKCAYIVGKLYLVMQQYVCRLAPRLQLLYSAAAAASHSSCTRKLSGQYTWVNIEVVAVKPYAAVVVSSFTQEEVLQLQSKDTISRPDQ